MDQLSVSFGFLRPSAPHGAGLALGVCVWGDSAVVISCVSPQ